jgi:hypothetical protein
MGIMKMSKQVRISLSDQDAEYLKSIAEQMGVKESEVLKKGLQLMALYAKTKEGKGNSLVLKTSDSNDVDKEIMII